MKRITAKKSGGLSRVFNIMEEHNLICEQEEVLSPKHLRYRGLALTWTVLVIFALFLLVGLSIDTGKVCLVNHQLHNAADAGALASAPWVKKDKDYTRELAEKFAELNYADKNPCLVDQNANNEVEGDVILGKYGFFPDLDKYLFIPYDPDNPISVNAVAVITSRDDDVHAGHEATYQLPLDYGPLAGVYAVELRGNWPGKTGPYAIAITGGGSGAGLLCIRHDGTGLHLHGEARLVVNNITDPYVYEDGAVTINSGDDELCLTTNGTPEIVADILNIHANDCTQVGNFQLDETPTEVWYGQPRMPDPLLWVNEVFKPTDNPSLMTPDLGGINIQNDGEVPNEPIPPGYYSGGLTFKGGTAENPVRLAGGIYIVDGPGLQVLANSYVVVDPANGDADGDGIGEAFFYVASTNWEADDTSCYVSGNAVIRSDPLSEGIYAGLMLAQDNLNLNDAEIMGTGDTVIEGTLYFPQERPAEEQKGGNGDGFALRLGGTGLGTGNQIITNSLYVYGTGDKIINYDGRNPSPISKAWLVE